jgi:hypothetical protein
MKQSHVHTKVNGDVPTAYVVIRGDGAPIAMP